MPVSSQSAYGLTWDQVRSGIGLGYFPFSSLGAAQGISGPHAGIVIIAGIDQSDYPNAFDHGVQITSPIGDDFGTGTAIVTSSCNAEGKAVYFPAGVETSVWGRGVTIHCDLAHLASYFIVLMLGNNIEGAYEFGGGTPPPPRKTSIPTVTTPASDDEWGFVTISWTTLDDLDTEVMGFIVWTHANYPGAVAYIVGNVPALATVHPNYSFTYAIGANEWPDPNYEYRFTVVPILWDSEPLNDPPTGTLGEESDFSDPVIFFPDGSPPIPPEEEEPDIELPPLDLPSPPGTGLPIPGVPVEDLIPPFIDPETGEELPPGTLEGVGYGGFNLGGSSLENAVFIMNPSGIYTLVEGKTHDTLYERMTGITSQNVKIPDPFAKTGFL